MLVIDDEPVIATLARRALAGHEVYVVTSGRDALEQIAATGRQALTDMRSLLGVLREDGRQEYAPQPDVAAPAEARQVAQLIERVEVHANAAVDEEAKVRLVEVGPAVDDPIGGHARRHRGERQVLLPTGSPSGIAILARTATTGGLRVGAKGSAAVLLRRCVRPRRQDAHFLGEELHQIVDDAARRDDAERPALPVHQRDVAVAADVELGERVRERRVGPQRQRLRRHDVLDPRRLRVDALADDARAEVALRDQPDEAIGVVGDDDQPVPGGIGRYVEGLLRHLPGAGVMVERFSAGRWRYAAWHRFRRPVVRIPGDLVHAPSLAVPPTGRRPLVVTIHDLAFRTHPECFPARGRAFHERGLALARAEAAAVIVPSEATAGEDEHVPMPLGAGSEARGVELSRWPAQPDEIAPAFVYFASEADSGYVTGEVLTLLGGETTAG